MRLGCLTFIFLLKIPHCYETLSQTDSQSNKLFQYHGHDVKSCLEIDFFEEFHCKKSSN